MNQQINLLLRMLTAVICGALIGLERSRRQKEAGIRTHIMVTLGATIIVIVSKYGFLDIVGVPGVSVDVARIAANVITGISFLGAGVIFLRGGFIKGLTTAAGIWSTAGVGCALGAGMYIIGIAATVMIILIQIFLHLFIPSSENMPTVELSIRIVQKKGILSEIKKRFENLNVTVLQMNITKHTDDSLLVDTVLRIPRNISPDDILDEMSGSDYIIEFSAHM